MNPNQIGAKSKSYSRVNVGFERRSTKSIHVTPQRSERDAQTDTHREKESLSSRGDASKCI
jgi:hypothetical protein